MTTAAEHRADHDLFIDTVHGLCQDPGARKAISRSRGRDLSHCADAHSYLAEHVFRHPIRKYAPRAHYTVAALIAATSTPHIPDQPPPQAALHAGSAAGTPLLTPLTPASPPAVDVPARTPQGAVGSPADDTADTPDSPGTAVCGPAGGTTSGPEAARLTGQAWQRRPDLGRTLAEAVLRRAIAHDSATRRLRALGKLSTDLLHPRLPALAKLLDQAGLDTDFAVLLDNLVWWDTDRARITSAWTLSFHLAVGGDTPAPTDLAET
ncbi:type I-E CRISPR-associated protein Cse2/CasB [Actinacidiphila acidipaludis]|uniref:Type I-E CRISPR-associated protein Cse2/CasB n=1 Tax=Actinacidiphila acidipaludis TaxID=2873382 RepID=A0ABS7QFI4_9ACTN|nr:type I-E CRISPR-associated protein Cse2/CasB [Streptomyces acidipaludis]MBY8881596.1 type I-E CRISPR-associated protein Cse2/CasB [Streptomyces acidipaludis]